MRIAVVGAGGFVGKALVAKLGQDGHRVIAVCRNPHDFGNCIDVLAVGDFLIYHHFSSIFSGVDCVVHLAGLAHTRSTMAGMRDGVARSVNVDLTERLFDAACKGLVKRFVYLSTAKVFSDTVDKEFSYTELDLPKPKDIYGFTKRLAELALLQRASKASVELVIVRSPLVYGFQSVGNLASLERIIASGMPLPAGAFHTNRRSLIAIDNLTDFMSLATYHPGAASQIFHVSDGHDISFSELCNRIYHAKGLNSRVFFLPDFIIKFTLRLIGLTDAYVRFSCSLRLDTSKALSVLDWKPVISLDDAIKRYFRNR